MSVGVATASASSGGGNPPSTSGGSQGKGTATVKYTAAYDDSIAGPLSCSGVHQTGKNSGVYGQDSFTCTSTTGLPLILGWKEGFVAGGPIYLPFGSRISDYYAGLDPPQFIFGGMQGTIAPDGFSFTAVATY
jgi:hypothetical protein